MFLINAIYFKGAWQKQFDKSKTAPAPFFALDGSTASVPLMHQSVPLRVSHAPTYTAVDLLYGNSAFAMTIVLPNQNVNVNTLVESLTGDSWKSLEESFTGEHQSEFYLPRFKLEWKRTLNPRQRALESASCRPQLRFGLIVHSCSSSENAFPGRSCSWGRS